MQPRTLVLALIAATVCDGYALPSARHAGKPFPAAVACWQVDTSHAGTPQQSCCSLEDDTADDLRSISMIAAVPAQLQPAARLNAVRPIAPLLPCLRTLEAQHIVLQV